MSRRSRDLPGSAGKRCTGQRVAGEAFLNESELGGREMRKSFLILNSQRCFLWKAECIERCLLGLGKGSWKRADDQSKGTGTVRFNHSRQPFWKRGNAPASYFITAHASAWICS
jgi:hypothetical protein